MIGAKEAEHRAKDLTVFGVKAVEDVDKELVNDVHDLAVVLIDGHLKVQPSELTEMPVSEGVFSPAGHHQNSFLSCHSYKFDAISICRDGCYVIKFAGSALMEKPDVNTRT